MFEKFVSEAMMQYESKMKKVTNNLIVYLVYFQKPVGLYCMLALKNFCSKKTTTTYDADAAHSQKCLQILLLTFTSALV